jgi:menaquinone-9 beta-reductase
MYDLIVIGAGPGGSSAAITAARAGARVLLLERGRFPRNKVCGEFVSAESLDLLSSLLGSSGRSLIEQAPRISRTRIFVDGLMLTSPVEPSAASIARLDLDGALWAAARDNGVEIRDQTTAQTINGEGPFMVSASGASFEGRAVINSSGRWSNLTATAQENYAAREKWLGVKAHFAEKDSPQSVDLYFFEGGYCGVQPVTLHAEGTQSRINVCAMVRSDVASNLTDVLDLNPSLKERSLKWQPLTDSISTSPLLFREPQPVEGNILRAGDAAGFVDPFVGDGISLALRTSALATRSLAPFFQGEASLATSIESYRHAYERDFLPVFRTSSQIRHIFLLPRLVRLVLLTALKHSPALTRYFIRHTR